MDPARRFRHCRSVRVAGTRALVAESAVVRLLGLAHLPPELCPAALWFPRCNRIHTLGMRFELELVFLDTDGHILGRRRVGPGRFISKREAVSVLEIPWGAPPYGAGL